MLVREVARAVGATVRTRDRSVRAAAVAVHARVTRRREAKIDYPGDPVASLVNRFPASGGSPATVRIVLACGALMAPSCFSSWSDSRRSAWVWKRQPLTLICGLSGGVDSSVVAVLVGRAVAGRLSKGLCSVETSSVESRRLNVNLPIYSDGPARHMSRPRDIASKSRSHSGPWRNHAVFLKYQGKEGVAQVACALLGVRGRRSTGGRQSAGSECPGEGDTQMKVPKTMCILVLLLTSAPAGAANHPRAAVSAPHEMTTRNSSWLPRLRQSMQHGLSQARMIGSVAARKVWAKGQTLAESVSALKTTLKFAGAAAGVLFLASCAGQVLKPDQNSTAEQLNQQLAGKPYGGLVTVERDTAGRFVLNLDRRFDSKNPEHCDGLREATEELGGHFLLSLGVQEGQNACPARTYDLPIKGTF